MIKNEPLITIVTVAYNAVKTIEKTILSIKKYKNSNIEYIIIDGGSKDGTVDIIKKYEMDIDFWISEPDKGIYDAMNKGWIKGNGKYIFFIGADDVLLYLPSKEMNDEKNIDVFFGDVQLSNDSIFKSKWNWKLNFFNTIHHQGLFIRKSLFKGLPFDINYRLYADFDVNQRLYKKCIRMYYINQRIAIFNLDGASSNFDLFEMTKIVYKNNGIIYWSISFMILFLMQNVRKKIVRLIHFLHK